jgi:hypothetical protein
VSAEAFYGVAEFIATTDTNLDFVGNTAEKKKEVP